MKSVVYPSVFCLIFFSNVILSCSRQGADKDDMAEWKEMEEFHTIMADVFHPLKDSGNLEVIRLRADELAANASRWAEAELPEKVNNDEVKSALSKLKDDARVLADQVKTQAADSIIALQLTDLHDQFHGLQEAWYKGDDEHHDH